MTASMADHDCEGQMQVLLRLLTVTEWHALWTELAVRVESFNLAVCSEALLGRKSTRKLIANINVRLLAHSAVFLLGKTVGFCLDVPADPVYTRRCHRFSPMLVQNIQSLFR
jgi:hypothetical protein